MKIALIPLLVAASAFAQTPSTPPTAACGPGNVSFKITPNYQPKPPAPSEQGKARVYFIHEAGSVNSFSLGYPTTKYGIDGAWAGANHADSWFAVSVEPGEHHLCATLQSSIVDDRVELAHFTAESDKDYYFRTRLVMSGQVELLGLELIDSDQGRYLIRAFPQSEWKARK